MALIETITDNFNDNSISATWQTSDSGNPSAVVEQNNRLEISHSATSQYNTLNTASTHDFTNTYAMVEVIDIGDQRIPSHEVQLVIDLDANNKLWLTFGNNTLDAYKKVAGVQSRVSTSFPAIPYNSGKMRWIRIRNSGANCYLGYSADGINWIEPWSLANPFTLTAVKPALVSGCWQNESVGSYGYYDNFNIINNDIIQTNFYTKDGFS